MGILILLFQHGYLCNNIIVRMACNYINPFGPTNITKEKNRNSVTLVKDKSKS